MSVTLSVKNVVGKSHIMCVWYTSTVKRKTGHDVVFSVSRTNILLHT